MTFKQVNKATARKMYRAGWEIKLLPCKVNSAIALDPSAQGHFWVNPVSIKEDSTAPVQLEDKSFSLCSDTTFDRLVNAFEYYNCNAELGYYSHYFVSESDYNTYKEEMKNGTQKDQEASV